LKKKDVQMKMREKLGRKMRERKKRMTGRKGTREKRVLKGPFVRNLRNPICTEIEMRREQQEERYKSKKEKETVHERETSDGEKTLRR